jgi:hypothetical protein
MNRHTGRFPRAIFHAFIFTALFLSLFFFPSTSKANPVTQKGSYKGIKIYAIPPNPGTQFDVDIMDSEQALAKLKEAIKLIYEQSLNQSQVINDLIEKGNVFLVYNPNYPRRMKDIVNIRVALFLPFYFYNQPDKKKPPIPVIISRHGIKWPVKELASVLIHELVGHGNQYLKGQTDTVRIRELECNAWLHQELAHQQFGLDKFSDKMVRFRQQLGGVGFKDGHCSEFLRFIKINFPEKIGLWEQLNPDVPELLKLLDQYIAYLDTSGTTQKSLRAREEYKEKELARLEKYGTPEEQFGTGLYLLEGAGYKQDLKRGIIFIQKAAQRNNPKAQYHLSNLYARGKGLDQDNGQAYFWLLVLSQNTDTALDASVKKKKEQIAGFLTREERSIIAKKAQNFRIEPGSK